MMKVHLSGKGNALNRVSGEDAFGFLGPLAALKASYPRPRYFFSTVKTQFVYSDRDRYVRELVVRKRAGGDYDQFLRERNACEFASASRPIIMMLSGITTLVRPFPSNAPDLVFSPGVLPIRAMGFPSISAGTATSAAVPL
jgi:hypothetical protein